MEKEVDKIIEEIMIYDHGNSKLKLELNSLIKKL